MCIWKAWKKTKTKVANLIKCGISHDKACSIGNARQSHWRMAKNYYVNTAISTLNLKKAGYLCLTDSYLNLLLSAKSQKCTIYHPGVLRNRTSGLSFPKVSPP